MKNLTLALLACSLLLTNCASATKSSAVAKSSDEDFPLEVIDAHTHTRFDGRPERTSKIAVTEDQYFKEWKEAHVVGAVSHVTETDNGYVDSLRSKNVIFCGGVGDHVNAKHIEDGL